MLIVEDQATMRAALREFMQAAYPQEAILEAADGAQALELCRSHRPRLVLMDLGLPDASGIDLIPRVKALVPECVIIVVSQHTERAYAERALAAGAFAYVSKGAIYSELLPAVADGLSGAPGGGARTSGAPGKNAPGTLRILLVEDSEQDAELVIRALRKDGIDAQFLRVQSAASLLTALQRQAWDAVIADFRLPAFSGLDALGMVRAASLDIPFILVSGTIGENAVAQVMKAGVNDFVTKENLARLAPALKRGLQEAATRAAHRGAQLELATSEAGLRHAQSMAGLAHAITRLDGEFESWSATLPALIGVDAQHMPASTRQWLEHVHPEDRARFRGLAIDAGTARSRAELEYRLRHSSGKWIHVRQVMEPLQDPVDAQGAMRWFNTLQDVTGQVVAAAALRASEERFRAMFERAGVGLTRSDLRGRFIEVNPKFCEITGYSREEALALGFQDLVHPEDLPEGVASRARLLRGDTLPLEREARVRRKDGTQIWINVTTSLVRATDGVPLHFVSVLHDVTERKAQRERIARLNRVYSVLSGINALIVRVRSPEELFRGACRIAVEAGEFRMAWIGLVDRGTMQVRPVAWQGPGEDYIRLMPLSLSASRSEGGGLPGQAIRERTPMVSDDMTRDPRVLLKKEALERGFHSLAILPLLVAGEAVGVLGLYAGEVGFFDDEEMKLLLELAGDIAFAMEHLEVRSKVDYLAFHDPLTGMPNRALLTDRLGQMLGPARQDGMLAGVLFLDVERFRLINDTLGRQAGDEFLKRVAERFRGAMRPQDTVARIGADVFAVAIASFAQVTDVTHLLSVRLAQAFAQPILVQGQELRAVLRAGVAVFPNDGDTAEVLCSNAEAALKQAKDAGERFVFYTPEINARVAELLALENRLRRALEAEQFVLHYQPKVDAKTRALVGFEALIRWNDPQRGLIPPGEFIPLMEETGIILQAGRWALGRAVSDVQAWRAKGLVAPRVAVNVSQIQLRQKDFVQTVLQALEGFGDAEPVLDLEITESMVMQNFDATVRALETLRDVGVETSLDDFGTGYSSLAYVSRLPVMALKIDRSFVIEMATSKYARTIVETVISLAHSLSLKVIAEGVDAEDQAALLATLGCDQMQGYLISKPLPPEQIEALLPRA